MKTKLITNQQDVISNILTGVNAMADTVGSTLGPRGQNVALSKFDYKGQIYGRYVLHDGVRVAEGIDLSDESANMAAQILKEAAKKQVDQVGDGTTVVMLLAHALVQETLKMAAMGINPMSLRDDLTAQVATLVLQLRALAKPIKTLPELSFVATISAEDKELGELVATTLWETGKDGVVSVEESQSAQTTVERQSGMQLEQGFLHQLFVTNPSRLEATLEHPRLLITDKPISSLDGLGKLLTELANAGKKLVIISPDVSGMGLALLIQNKLEGKLLSLAIKAPSFGENQKGILQDIAALTGAKFISEDAGYRFEDVTQNDLGFADSVTATKTDTIIVGGKGKKAAIEARVSAIKQAMKTEENDFDLHKLKERLAKLTDGVAVIRVGGQTEIEMHERRERVLDAVHAAKAAMDEGIVPGGERIYFLLRDELDLESPAGRILHKALAQPFKRLMENSGIAIEDAVTRLHNQPSTFGIDVTDGRAKDMLKAGIIDPVAVSIHALQNALSVALLLSTTGRLIVPDIQPTTDKGGDQ